MVTLTGNYPLSSSGPYVYLRELNLAGNQLSILESRCLDVLPDLERFVVSRNYLDSLPDTIVQQNKRLISFDGSDNRLTKIPTFSDLVYLDQVNLASNEIASIDSPPFSDCPALRTVDSKKNKLVALSNVLLSGATNVESLDLSSNRIARLDPDTFSGLTKLRHIYLRNNSLTSLSANVFKDCSLLQSLDLGNNSIADLSPDSFSGLTSLVVLQLDNNNLTSVPSEVFSDLPSIQTLYLGGNPIIQIHRAAFAPLSTVVELFLDRTPTLRRIDKDAFQELHNLERLALSNNPNLVDFTPDHLPVGHVPKLKSIYLYGDGFVYLDVGIFDDKPELKLADLYNNPFNCSCDLKWMARVVRDKVTWASHWATSSTPPRCRTPDHLRDWPIPTMVEDDMTCDELDMVRASPEHQMTHLRSEANISVHLFNGLPSSIWKTPDNEWLVPYPVGEHPLNLRRYASWAIVANNTIESTLFVNNASLSDEGFYTVRAMNIASTKSIDFHLKVLPYQLTTTTPAAETTESEVSAAPLRTCRAADQIIIIIIITILFHF